MAVLKMRPAWRGSPLDIRRFLLHVLPSGFQRIRHYGLLANRYREVRLNQCRDLLAAPAPVVVPFDAEDYRDRYQRLTGVSLRDCQYLQYTYKY